MSVGRIFTLDSHNISTEYDVLQMEEDGWCNDCLRNADECTFNLMEKDELPLCYQYQKEREKNNG